MQDLDYEVLYEPGEDEADPLDYLSWHPGKQTVNSSKTETVVKYISRNKMQWSLNKFNKRHMRHYRLWQRKYTKEIGGTSAKRRILSHIFTFIREELSYINGMIYRLDKLVLPNTLQEIINISHKLGHLGATKTKQMMRKSYECKVTSKSRREEPIKVATIPSIPWDHGLVSLSSLEGIFLHLYRKKILLNCLVRCTLGPLSNSNSSLSVICVQMERSFVLYWWW